MSAVYSVRCNDCSVVHPDATSRISLANARRLARSLGWTHPGPGLDFCKVCSEARAKRAKEENPNGYH